MFVFKDNFHSLSKIMEKICNLVLQRGIFPGALKRARVTPIYITNERWSQKKLLAYIGVVLFFAKFLEKVEYVQLEQY